MSNGLSGMGFGLPAAIAVQLARRDKPVMAVVGDGGMLMMLHDLCLLKELKLPVITVVMRDGSLSLIRVSAERRDFPANGADFTPPDFAAIAQAFGICGKWADSLEEVGGAVEASLGCVEAIAARCCRGLSRILRSGLTVQRRFHEPTFLTCNCSVCLLPRRGRSRAGGAGMHRPHAKRRHACRSAIRFRSKYSPDLQLDIGRDSLLREIVRPGRIVQPADTGGGEVGAKSRSRIWRGGNGGRPARRRLRRDDDQ
jgi:hypothetical protein